MKLKLLSAPILTIFVFSAGILAQNPTIKPNTERPEIVVKTATPTPKPTPKLSEMLAKTVETSQKDEEIPRERREQAYAKLLEGQRYIWNLSRQRGQTSASVARLAKQALQKSVELDPNLAEGYTALAELALTTPPSDLNEAISLATIAAKIDSNNFGAQRILSRLYTIKSGLNTSNLDAANAQKAMTAWMEITRLDPRNAEAWAFLSEFYKRTGKNDKQINALQKWLGSTAPLETRFYKTVLGNDEDLSPENASVKLGAAFYDAGRFQESVEILNQAVADNPENQTTIDLLARSLEKADDATAATAIQSLQQAIYTNPENVALVMLFAKVQTRAGNSAGAAKFISETSNKLAEKDKNAAANLQIALGDLYRESNRADEAAAAYQKALTIAGIDKNNLATDDQRDFTLSVFDKIIRAYKNANRFNDAKLAIDNSRAILGEEDSFSDRQIVALYRENGKKQEELQALRAARLRFPEDYGFLRQEATVLGELGKVDEGVAIVKTLLGKKKTDAPTAMYDDFTNYLFISMLYSDAKRGKEAVEAANQAMQIAVSDERKLIAKLMLATAQQNSGDFKSAETTLRQILTESPNNPIAQNNLGYFLADRNEKLDEALKLIQEAVKAEPENSSFLDSLGWVYFKMNKLDLAAENLQKALKSDSASATIYEHLGDVYQKQGKPELAKTAWQNSLTLSSDTEQMNSLKLKIGKKAAK